jgi:hypothetical protein
MTQPAGLTSKIRDLHKRLVLKSNQLKIQNHFTLINKNRADLTLIIIALE